MATSILAYKNDQNTGIKRFAIVSTITKNFDTIKEKGLIHHVSILNILDGTLEATRTPDPQLRRLLLYPTELQAHFSDNYIK